MATVEHLLQAIRKLPPKERRRLVAALRPPRKARRTRRRPQRPSAGYQRLLALAGTAHSDFTDVSSDKYKHLAEIYASQP